MKDNDLLDGKDDFVIFTPGCLEIDLSKGGDIEKDRPIGGVCSTERLDRQDESVLAKGLDFDEFVHHGFFNDNHKQNTADVVGVPNKAELRKGRWWTEGNLLTGHEPADRIWSLAKALNKSTNARRLGFSIEGKVIERGFDNRILKAKIRHVAITNSPVNTDCTWDILVKSFGSIEEQTAGEIRRALSADSPLTSQPKSVERKPLMLTFDEAVKIVKSNRPNYTWSTCERVARLIYKLQERRN
jgi:hypothetical protein